MRLIAAVLCIAASTALSAGMPPGDYFLASGEVLIIKPDGTAESTHLQHDEFRSVEEQTDGKVVFKRGMRWRLAAEMGAEAERQHSMILEPQADGAAAWALAGEWETGQESMARSVVPVPMFATALPQPIAQGMRDYFAAQCRRTSLRSAAERANLDPAIAGKESSDALALAESILAAAPDSTEARLAMLDALVLANDEGRLAVRLAEWRAELLRHPSPLMAEYVRVCDRELAGLRLSRERKNAFGTIVELLSPHRDLASRESLMLGLRDFSTILHDEVSVFVSIPPSFLELQTTAKVFAVRATLAAIRGDRDRAFDLAFAVFRLGQLQSRTRGTFPFLIGIAIKFIAMHTLEQLLAGACQSAEETARFDARLAKLADLEQQWRGRELDREVKDRIEYLMPLPALEMENRNLVAGQRYLLLRAAAATQLQFQRNGAWPSSGEVPGLADVFSGRSVQWRAEAAGGFVYSVGPDGRDEGASLRYDPTNGTVSGGDVFIELRSTPKYLFPRATFDPKSLDGIAAQFHNGLPPDLFADTKGRPLEARGNPLRIFSFGPDVDENSYGGKPDAALQPPYDPTNGTISAGNLYLE